MSPRCGRDASYVMCFASLGDYRLPVMQAVSKQLGDSLAVYTGSPPYDPSIKLLDARDIGAQQLRNKYLPGDILVQNVPIRHLISAKVVLMDLNPRVPHIWLTLAVRRALRRRTVLWGHAFPRRGASSRTGRIRLALAKCADALVTYTKQQAKEIEGLLPKAAVYPAPNALLSRQAMGFEPATGRTGILCVGRLEGEKKPSLLLEAFARLVAEGSDANLTFVGEGSEEPTLRRRTSQLGLSERVRFLGHVTDISILRREYARAVVSVSPGYVGLSLIQSLGFGVPMLISRNEHHSPEIEAAISGWNSVFFRTDDVAHLTECLIQFMNERGEWLSRGDAIASDAANRYSVEAMAEGLIAAMKGSLR